MMENLTSLEKIDLIRQRLGVSYGEAKDALDQAKGDVVSALVLLEERERYEEMHPPSSSEGRVWGQFKTLVHKGNTTRIQLKKGERTLLQVPVTVGALGIVGAVVFPALAVVGAAGMAAALASKCSLELGHQDNGGGCIIDPLEEND